MSRIGILSEYVSYKYVTYYTIKLEDTGETLLDDFLIRMIELGKKDGKVLKDFTELRLWLKHVGDSKNGVQLKALKDEHNCNALPEKNVKGLGLRLYCYWINERVVILFNGDNKIKDDARYCPNVKSHFYRAQSLTRQLNEYNIDKKAYKISNPEEIILNY